MTDAEKVVVALGAMRECPKESGDCPLCPVWDALADFVERHGVLMHYLDTMPDSQELLPDEVSDAMNKADAALARLVKVLK